MHAKTSSKKQLLSKIALGRGQIRLKKVTLLATLYLTRLLFESTDLDRADREPLMSQYLGRYSLWETNVTKMLSMLAPETCPKFYYSQWGSLVKSSWVSEESKQCWPFCYLLIGVPISILEVGFGQFFPNRRSQRLGWISPSFLWRWSCQCSLRLVPS